MLDVLLRNATVIDGSGKSRYVADVGLGDGMIASLGKIDESAKQVIDAEGLAVAPGFIDVHTHFDVQGFWDPYLTPAPFHGVTTVFAGNCGFTVAPLSGDSGDYLMRMLARVEGMPLSSLQAGVPWDWRSSAEYLDRLDGELALNAGFFIGHSAIRYGVMGGASLEREATDDELATMKQLLREGLTVGGFGLSTSNSPTHNDDIGRPVPSRMASRREFIELAAQCAEFPGTSLEILPGLLPFTNDEMDLMSDMSVAAQRAVNWNPLEVSAETFDLVEAGLAASDRAAERGGRIVALTVPVSLALYYSFATGVVLDSLPGWGETFALPIPERMVALGEPIVREKLERGAAEPNRLSSVAEWDQYIVAQIDRAELKGYEGRLVSDIAREQGVSLLNAMLDIACADDLRTTFSPIRDVSPADWAARLSVWRDDRAVIGASDAGAHLDFLAAFDLQTRMLEQAVREQELLSLEEAVHLLTQRPAALYGLIDRGTVKEGFRADLVVFDPERIGAGPVSMRSDLPGGASRLYGEGEGIESVYVNGELVVRRGELTGARPGTMLRAGRDSVTPVL